MSHDLLLLIDVPPNHLKRLQEAYIVHDGRDPAKRKEAIESHGGKIRAVVTNGSTGLDDATMAALPKLEIVSAMGAGYEKVDVKAAKARGLIVTYGPGVNDACAADHAMALLLSAVRGIPAADKHMREGGWRVGNGTPPGLNGKSLGILGLGNIGQKVAQRAAAFEIQVAYHNRHPKADVPYLYVGSAVALARDSDYLVVALPGGATSRHVVNAEVLEALGPKGFVVNIGRGGAIDTNALIAALREGQIAGAALDVFDNEPTVDRALLDTPNLIMTPHVAGRSPEAVEATISLLLRNLATHFAGQPVPTPAP